MPIALHHKKSRPAWLALIAVVAAGVTIVVTLASVVISGVMQARRSAELPGAATPAARAEDQRAVRVTVPTASQESPDALAAKAEAGSKAAAQAAVTPRTVIPGPSAPALSQGEGSRMEKTTDGEVPAAAATSGADGPATQPKHRYLPSHGATHAGAHRDGGGDAARGEGTLRADITRYNAERGNGAGRRRALRAASVPSARSLWDEVPRPLSELYRN